MLIDIEDGLGPRLINTGRSNMRDTNWVSRFIVTFVPMNRLPEVLVLPSPRNSTNPSVRPSVYRT